MYLWRAVDAEGEVLDILVQPRRDKRAVEKLIRKLLRKQGNSPMSVVTDKLRSHGAALGDPGLKKRHETGGRLNNRAENSPHFPMRRASKQVTLTSCPFALQTERPQEANETGKRGNNGRESRSG